ncbi:kinase-like protein, partial [Morchella conica CCBAS932]
EFYRDGDLEDYLEDQGALGDESAKRITKNLLEALRFLHEKGISHRDVKPENVLIVSKVPLNVKLTNFAISVFSKPSGGSAINVRQGTLAYMAPELFGMFGREIGCTNPADIWALGCLLFKMFTLKTPF